MFTDEETQSKVIIKLAQGILGGELKGVHSGRMYRHHDRLGYFK